tara:strand:- start:3994 stop:4377 length:384 start_codon:yes stop_codon:yes gene_type:complete
LNEIKEKQFMLEVEIAEAALDLAGHTSPNRELKQVLFNIHNKIYESGLSKRWIVRKENPNTMCGSCIRRVRQNFWKFYHFEYEGLKPDDIVFHGREGGGSIENSRNNFSPIYVKAQLKNTTDGKGTN